MSKLVNDLVQKGYLKSERIIDAFSEISRVEFVSEDFRLQADANVALPIGYGKIIPDPLIMAMIMEILDPQEGCQILDATAGSGWTTALLAFICGKNGKVLAVESNLELKKIGEYNVDKFGYIKKGIVQFFGEGEFENHLANMKFDRILVSSGIGEKHTKLKNQLNIGGKMVISINNNVTYWEKKAEDEFEEEKYSGFSLDPLFVR